MGKYKDDMVIDKDRLDEEWEQHVLKVEKWGTRQVDAQEQFDIIKDKYELIYAQIGAAIRARPEKFGLKDKVTEAAISGAIIRTEEYKKIRKEVIAADKEVRSLNVVLRTLEHRKKALERLQDLFLQGYWSEPRAKKGSVVEKHFENRDREKHKESISNFDKKYDVPETESTLKRRK